MTATRKVTVQLLEDKSLKAIMQGTIKALKNANRKSAAEEFQHEAVSSGRPFMDVVKEYAELV